MSDKTKKALRNLKVGGIYTPIVFGLIFICIKNSSESTANIGIEEGK
jgi:hypothetical protein